MLSYHLPTFPVPIVANNPARNMFMPFPPPYHLSQSSYHRTAQGKVAELRLELSNAPKKDKNHTAKKITLKKIVANMTMSNNDMVGLFPDVIACMQIPSLEIKKM
jgi:AP-2 complex subunit beta-1